LESAAAEEHRQPGATRPPYVSRSIDATLRQAITSLGTTGGAVVVQGRPKAGKSRTLFEALAATPTTRDRALYAIRPPDGRTMEGADRPIAAFLDAGPHLDGPNTVIWVDDAHEHFEYGLTLARLQRLLDRYPGVIMAMTVHAHRLDVPPRSADGELTAVDAELLRYLRALSERHELDVELDDEEMADACREYPGLEEAIEDPGDFARLPGWFAGVSYLRRRYRDSSDEHLGGRAIAKAAID
jgi:hypothetical protein